MTLEEMMHAVETFRSWPDEVRRYCVKTSMVELGMSDAIHRKPCIRTPSTSVGENHGGSWKADDEARLLVDVEKSPVKGKQLWKALSPKYGRTPKALQNRWHILTGIKE